MNLLKISYRYNRIHQTNLKLSTWVSTYPMNLVCRTQKFHLPYLILAHVRTHVTLSLSPNSCPDPAAPHFVTKASRRHTPAVPPSTSPSEPPPPLHAATLPRCGRVGASPPLALVTHLRLPTATTTTTPLAAQVLLFPIPRH
jgi:hypothetical protein